MILQVSLFLQILKEFFLGVLSLMKLLIRSRKMRAGAGASAATNLVVVQEVIGGDDVLADGLGDRNEDPANRLRKNDAHYVFRRARTSAASP